MGEATVLADIAIYDCPEGNLEAVAHILSETGFSLRDGIGAHDRGQLVLGQRYWCDEFCGGNEFFEQLAYLGCVGLFQKGADYLRSPAVVYIAQGEWRKLHAELFKAAPLVPWPWSNPSSKTGRWTPLHGSTRRWAGTCAGS